MFANMTSLQELKLGSNFKTASVENMSYMFSGMSKLKSLNLSTFNTSNVENMRNMFYNVSGLTQLDLSMFNTQNVTDMSSMFNGMKNLNSLDISNFKTENVTTMERMFKDCRALTTLDLNHFNVSNVTTMSEMFSSMIALTRLDLGAFTLGTVNMNSFVESCITLAYLDLRSADFTYVTGSSKMFDAVAISNSIEIIVLDETAQTWIENRLAEVGKTGTVTVYTPPLAEGEGDGENTL